MKKLILLTAIMVLLTGCRSYDIEEKTIKFADDGKTKKEVTTKKNKSTGWWFFSDGQGKSFSFLNPSLIGK